MSSPFEISFSRCELNNIKEKEILAELNFADDFCSYINKFLPRQLSNCGEVSEASDNENDEPGEKKVAVLAYGNTTRAKTIEELHNRIEKLRGKKVNYKEKLLKKGLKNRLKKKQKLEERKQFKNATRKQDSKMEIKNEGVGKCETEEKSSMNVVNALQFNKIVLSGSEEVDKSKTTDPKRILQQIEKRNDKLKKLEMKGKKDKVQEIKNKEIWNAAIKKAEGVKIKDNVELLKKSITKIKQRKNKSKKKWEEREKFVQTKKEEAHKKRQENINKKRKERVKKRTKMLVKKTRILPK